MATRGVNKVIIVGNLGQDPEVGYLPNGNAVANVSVATSDSWKDQQGQQQERTEWHRITIYGKLAEIAGEYLRKGSQVYFEGRLQTRKWEQEGQDRYTTEIIIDQRGSMQMLGSKPEGQGTQAPKQQPPRQQAPQQRTPGQRSAPQQTGGPQYVNQQQTPQHPNTNENTQPAYDPDSAWDDIPF